MLGQLFDAAFYLETNPDVAAAGFTEETAINHYLEFGFSEGRDPHPLFDTSFYFSQRLDVFEVGLEPFSHFLDFGFEEDTLDGSGGIQSDPNRFFDSAEYLADNQDVANAGIVSLVHYELFGEAEIVAGNRGPLSTFDAAFYAETNPDVAAAVEAGAFATFLEHFVRFGLAEGRPPLPNPTFELSDVTVDDTTALLELNSVPGTTEITVNDDDGVATIAGRDDATDSLRLTGDANVRVDFTDPFEQIEQIDINGNGQFDPGTDEFNVRDKVSVQHFEILDAHPRIVFDDDGNVIANGLLDPTDTTNGFTGDILFDGTGFGGDGVNTNGNIVLGGWGDDVVFGGIGNDFLTGGGGENLLSGGRNADFFYLELSTLDSVFAGETDIKGGSTFDNDPRQDSDWLLLEASDDQEPVTIRLDGQDIGDGAVGGAVGTENPPIPGAPIAGTSAFLEDIEHINASGNFYDFLTTFDVAVDTIAIRVAYFDAANDIEAWDRLQQFSFQVEGAGGVETFAVTREDVLGFVGEDAAFDRDDWLATANELFGDEFTIEVDAVDDTVQGIEQAPAIRFEDNSAEERDFVDGSVQQVFVDEGDAVNTQRVAEPVTVPLSDPFVDLYFGDFRDFTPIDELGLIRIPGLSPGVTAQMDIEGSAETNIIIGGYDNDRIDGGGGNDLLFGGDLQFLMEHRHVVNAFSTETGGIVLNTREDGPTSIADSDVIADAGRDTLIGGAGDDSLVIEFDGGVADGGVGLDTLWVTDFSSGRLVNDGQDPDFNLIDARAGNGNTGSESNAVGALLDDAVFRLDLGTGTGIDYQGFGGADLRVNGQFTADQNNYDAGERSLVTNIENVNASGLGEIDYLAAGQNDPELVFANQQNYNGTGTALDLRGIDTLDLGDNDGGESDVNDNNFTADQLIYFQTDESYVIGWDGAVPKIIDGLNTGQIDRAGSPETALEDQGPTPSSELTGRENRIEENELVASTGNDVIEGRGGNDRLSGREGDDVFLISLNAGDARRDGSSQDDLGDGINIISRDLDIYNYERALESAGLDVGNLPVIAEQTAAQRDGGLVSVGVSDPSPNGRDGLVDRVDPETGRLSNNPDHPTVIGQDFRVPEGDLLIPEFAISASGNLRTDAENSTTGGEPFQFLDVVVINFVEPVNGESTVRIEFEGGTAVELRDAVQEGLNGLVGEGVYTVVLGDATNINNGVNDNDEPLNNDNAIAIEVDPNADNPGQFAINSINFEDSVPLQPGFGGYDAVSEAVSLGQGDDDELVFVSYNDRLDNELAADLNPVADEPYNAESLGKDAYAEDLVTRVVDGSTIITEGQEYRIYFEDLAKGDEVRLTINGVQYTLTVGFTVNGVEVDGQSTEDFVAELASLVNLVTAIDPNTAAGEVNAAAILDVADADGAEADNNAILVLRQGDGNASGAEQVFMEFPTVEVIDQETGGQSDEAIAIVKETSDTSAVLYGYDGSAGAAGLNRGVDAEDDRAEGRYITFEGQDGLGPDGLIGTADDGDNRAILQTADPTGGATLEGLEAFQTDTAGVDRVARQALPESPGNGNNEEIGEPTEGAWAALHGDDLLIGSDANDDIAGLSGDDRIVGSRGDDDVDGGLDLVVDSNGVVVDQVNGRDDPDIDAGETLLTFTDSLVFEERDFQLSEDDDPSFTVVVSNITDPGSGQVLVDEDGNGTTDHTTDFVNIEVVRTLSGQGPLGDGNSPTPNDVLDVSAASAAAEAAADLDGITVFNDGGTLQVWTNDDDVPVQLLLEVEGVETIIGGAGDDVLWSTNDSSSLAGGEGDNIYVFGPNSFVLEGVDTITGDFDFNEGGGEDGDYDRIDLSNLPVENGLTLVLDADADVTTNQVRVVVDGGDSFVTVIGDSLDDQFSFIVASDDIDSELDFIGVGAADPEVVSITPDVTTINETDNNSVTYTIDTQFAVGETVTLAIDGASTAGATDISGLPATVTVGADGTASFTVTADADLLTEGSETLIIEAAIGGQTPVNAAAVTIEDTSVAPIVPEVVSITPDVTTINETDSNSVTYTVDTANASEGDVITLAIDGASTAGAADISGLPATVTVGADGTASFTVTANADDSTEGTETLIIEAAIGGQTPVNAAAVTIEDTSLDPVEVIVDLSGETAVTADAAVAEVFVFEFNSATGSSLSSDAIVAIDGFDPATDLLRFDDAADPALSADNFLGGAATGGAIITLDQFGADAGTLVNFGDDTADPTLGAGSVRLLGIFDVDLGGATPFFEVA